MKKNKIWFCVLIFTGFIFSFILLFSNINEYNNDKKIVEISVISKAKNTEKLACIKQGIDQAASDTNSDISFITLSNENDIDEQIFFINRELNNGADAIILSPANSSRLSEYLKRINVKIPIIAIESNIDSDKVLAYFSSDNYNMGKSLGIKISDISNKNIAIITSSLECENIKQRYNGLTESLENNIDKITILDVKSNSKENEQYIKDIIIQNNINILVSPDLIGLELICQISESMPDANLQVFGIGNTNNIISYLEKGIINTLIVQNDFSIGYLAVDAAVNIIKNKKIYNGIEIEYKLITKDNMYEIENQRLLFPFIR